MASHTPTLSQFVITAHDENGKRLKSGGEQFNVFVRGVHPPSKLRCKLHDSGDGHYTGEYKAEVSGDIEIAISLNGLPIVGSPFYVTAVTLQARADKCRLRGDGLSAAVARRPATFEVCSRPCPCPRPCAHIHVHVFVRVHVHGPMRPRP